MTRRYRVLVVVLMIAALGVSALARRPRTAAPRSAATAPIAEVELAVVIDGGRIVPEAAAVPQGRLVRLRISNRGSAAVNLRLAGYEDRVAVTALAAGATWSGTFIADRPGEDFAWLVDERPAGRLAVTGSHLLEGHR